MGVGITYLVVQRAPLPFAAKDVALPITLWFVWLLIGPLWAGDKASALRYVLVVFTMVAATAATAAVGGSRRHLRVFGLLMILSYALILGFTVLEAGLGVRLPVSALYNAVNSSQTFAVTSVFHNQNDLATYIALCWPFMLAAFFFTRRRIWLILDVLFIVLGAAAFVRSGSRSSLIAAGILTLAAAVLFARLGRRLGPRLSTRSARSSGLAWRSCSWPALATCCSTTRSTDAARVPSRVAPRPGADGLGLRSHPCEPHRTRPGDRRRQLPCGRRARPSRSHHLLGHQRPRHLRPARAGGWRRSPTAVPWASCCI